jgi:hypothetical protein
MKTLHLLIIIGIGIVVVFLGSSNAVYAPCASGVTGCTPPDPIFLTDSKGNIDNFLTNHQILIRYDAWARTPDSKSMDLEINFTSDSGPILDDKEQLSLDLGKPTSIIWKFIPTKTGKYTIEKFSNGIHTSTTFFSVTDSKESKNLPVLVSPLRQFKFGVAAENVQCSQNFVLLIKKSDHSPACVKSEDASKFMASDWIQSPSTGVPQLLEQIQQSSENTTLPASFELCNTPYELREGFVPVLYLPTNSLGKVCVNYSNPNNARNASLLIFDASSYQPEKSITTWAEPSVIPTGNSTIVYFVNTGNHTGFYGLTVFCVGIPLAVGYDNQSNIIINYFPWMKPFTTFHCPMLNYQFKVVGVSGIGIKYIPNQ